MSAYWSHCNMCLVNRCQCSQRNENRLRELEAKVADMRTLIQDLSNYIDIDNIGDAEMLIRADAYRAERKEQEHE